MALFFAGLSRCLLAAIIGTVLGAIINGMIETWTGVPVDVPARFIPGVLVSILVINWFIDIHLFEEWWKERYD